MNRYMCKAKRNNWKELPKSSRWVVGYYQQRFDYKEEKTHLIFVCNSSTVWEYAEIDEKTLCQCTGIMDVNKNIIFEHDIVQDERKGMNKERKEVVWNEEEGMWTLDGVYGLGNTNCNDYKIIGNKFEK